MSVWWDTDWGKRIDLVVSDPQPGLRVLVVLSEARSGFSYSDTKAGGDDIRFTSDDQATELPYEIETWNASGESFLWVALPTSAPPGVISMYYDNAAASPASSGADTFAGNDVGIWHLKEDPAGTPPPFKDSTANGFDLTAYGPAGLAQIDAKIGKGLRCWVDPYSPNSYGYHASDAKFNDHPLTLSCWVRARSGVGDGYRPIIKKTLPGGDSCELDFDSGANRPVFIYSKLPGTNSVTVNGTIGALENDVWYLLHAVSGRVVGANTKGELYINGQIHASANWIGTAQDMTNAGQVKIGNAYIDIDEARWINEVKDAAFVSADYKSQTDTLLTWGLPQTAPAHQLDVTIAGTKRTVYMMPGTFEINDVYNNRRTARCRLVDETNYIRDGVSPFSVVQGNVIKFEYDGTKIFEGMVDRVTTTVPFTGGPTYYDLECVDYTALCDRRLVAKVYSSGRYGGGTGTVMKAGAIVKAIITTYMAGDGIITTGVDDGSDIWKIVFPYCTVTEAISDLAKMSAYIWRVDYDKNLLFYDPSTNPAPFDLTAGSGNFRNLKAILHREQYRNRQYLRAGNATTDTQQERFYGTSVDLDDDNAKRTFSLMYAVAEEPSITLNGVAVPVGIRGQDDGQAFFYFVKGEKEITYDAELDPLLMTDYFEVSYRGLYPIFQLKQSSTEIAARATAEGNAGKYEAIIEDESIEDEDYASDYLTMVLRQNGVFADCAFYDYQTDTGGMESGMVQTINVPQCGINDSVMVDNVRTHDIITGDGPILRYDVRAVGGEHIGGWAEFWKKVTAGQKKMLREGEALTLLQEFFEEVDITEDFNQTDVLSDWEDDTYSVFRVGYSTVGYTFHGNDSARAHHQEAVGNMIVGDYSEP